MSTYSELCSRPSDINEHLPTLAALASECHHVTEMGTRYIVSTWAFLEGLKEGDTLIAIDYKHPREYNASLDSIEAEARSKGVNFIFKEENTLTNEIEETDLLFIDTDHTYIQLKQELARHGSKARKYLAFHDTVSCEGELMPAIAEFIIDHPEWNNIFHRAENNNGCLILEKKC